MNHIIILWFYLVDQVGPVTLKFLGRQLHLKKACDSILDTTFNELCEQVRRIISHKRLYILNL